MFRATKSSTRPGTFESVLGEGLKIEGTLYSEGSLRIDGKVDGKVRSDCEIMIGQNASIKANIKAVNITIAGEVSGDIDCEGRLEILPSGKLTGDVTVGSLVISEGALFFGTSSMSSAKDTKTKPVIALQGKD